MTTNSDKVKKNKYTDFQLIALIKFYRALYLQRLVLLCCLDLKVLCCLDLLLLESVFFNCKLCLFEQGISLSIFISIRYMQIKTNKVIHNAGSKVYSLLSTNMGVSPLHGLTVASLGINQIYTKIDKVKIKPYLNHNNYIG